LEILHILHESDSSGSNETEECNTLTVLLLVILILKVVIMHQIQRNVNSVPNSRKNLKLYLLFHSQVKLLNKMKEEAAKHKDVELRRNREIAQLRKESRKRENTIRSLEAEKRVKDAVLKRKQEEVTALRKMQRGPLSNKAAGRVGPRHGKLVECLLFVVMQYLPSSLSVCLCLSLISCLCGSYCCKRYPLFAIICNNQSAQHMASW